MICLKYWWLVLSLFPLISHSWELTAKISSTDFLLKELLWVNPNSLWGQYFLFFFQGLKRDTSKALRPWCWLLTIWPFSGNGWIPSYIWCAWKGFWSPSSYSTSSTLPKVPWSFLLGIDPEAIICPCRCLLDHRDLAWTWPLSFLGPF